MGNRFKTVSPATIKLVAGPLVFILFIFFFNLEPGQPVITRTAAVALWMAIWWMTEAVPLAVTALLPMVLFPLLGIQDSKAVAPQYFNHVIFLFIGGFLVALAMQKWELHRRIALQILRRVGARPSRILLGFMIATAFLSMWISNTATTMMMIPIALAIIAKIEDHADAKLVRRYAIGVFLGVAYAASIGGIATLVGTPPNLAFIRILAILFPEAPEISFATWILFGLPISIVFLVIVWRLLAMVFVKEREKLRIDRSLFVDEVRALGPMTFAEKVILTDFVLLALLWLTRSNIQIGHFTFHGWSNWFPHPEYISDGSVAITLAVILFVIPSKSPSGGRIITWKTTRNLPWDIVLLFGGGFALAAGFKESGLSQWLGHHLTSIGNFPPLAIVLVICLFVTFLTELTSNTATAQILLPIIAALAVQIGVNPLLLMIPTTLSCSFAFMLPVATPPNAIIFGTGQLHVSDMAKVGIWLNLMGAVLITAAIYFLGTTIFGIDFSQVPAWAVLK